MRIKTKFRVNTFFSITMILIIGLTEFVAFKQVSSVLEKRRTVDQIVGNAFDLNLLTYEYLREHSERVRIQWHLRHEVLSELIQDVMFGTEEQQLLIRKIRHNHENMKTVFSIVVKNYENRNISSLFDEKKLSDLITETEERFAGQLLAKSQAIISSVEQLNSISEKEVMVTQRNNGWFILSVVAVIGLMTMINSFFISRSIGEPVAILCSMAKTIGKGNMNLRITLDTKDEIDDLAEAFNQMAHNLTEITVSRDTLYEEVSERRKTEDELRKARKELEKTNIQLMKEVTEHEIAEHELRKLKNYLNNIINSMPSVLVGIDKKEQVMLWNLEAENITGISADTAYHQPLTDVFPQLREHAEIISRTIASQEPQKTEKMPIQHNGQTLYADIMIYPLVTNEIEGAVLRVDDVTARVRLEEMMIQTEKMMSVGGLAAGMAHEINNPLAGILQSIQNVLRRISPDLPANEKAANECGIKLNAVHAYMEKRNILKFLEGIRDSGERAAKIVGNMLNFSRRTEYHMVPVNMSEILDKTIELASHDYDLKKKYDFRHIEIIRDYDSDMPQVRCTATEIEQVILNLLRNAAQAMNVGQASCLPAENKQNACSTLPRITIRLKKDDSMAQIEVKDNGSGMDENTRKRIFEPFFTTKNVGVGTGLGLSVSYFIITNNHKGTMTVESELGKGTKFIIRLPL